MVTGIQTDYNYAQINQGLHVSAQEKIAEAVDTDLSTFCAVGCIQVSNLGLHYGSVCALKGIDIEIDGFSDQIGNDLSPPSLGREIGCVHVFGKVIVFR